MLLQWPTSRLGAFYRTYFVRGLQSKWIVLGLLAVVVALADAMTPNRIEELRQETILMFYHGFDNYMNIAFPEDEVGIIRDTTVR
jgi:hypothetical protein